LEAAWRSRPHRGMEELREALAAEKAAAWRTGHAGLQLDRGRWWVDFTGQMRVSALDDGAAATVIDLSEWAWTRGRAGRA
jgi:hypothetical protein